jgi:uncharacterized membrane protein
MPLPQEGPLSIEKQLEGIIFWDWAMGMFTAVGGLAGAIIFILYGFTATLVVAILLYCCVLAVLARFRKTPFTNEKEADLV